VCRFQWISQSQRSAPQFPGQRGGRSRAVRDRSQTDVVAVAVTNLRVNKLTEDLWVRSSFESCGGPFKGLSQVILQPTTRRALSLLPLHPELPRPRVALGQTSKYHYKGPETVGLHCADELSFDGMARLYW